MKNSKHVNVNAKLNFLFFILTLLIGMVCIAKTAFGQVDNDRKPDYEFINDSTSFTVIITDIGDMDSIRFLSSTSAPDTAMRIEHDGTDEGFMYYYNDNGVDDGSEDWLYKNKSEDKLEWMVIFLKDHLGGLYHFAVRRTDSGFDLMEEDEFDLVSGGVLVKKPDSLTH